MKRIVLIAVGIFSAAFSFAQSITGTVTDAKTNTPLPFVNIGVVGKGIGTVTDDKGHYSLSLNQSATDTIRISMIGYQPRAYVISEFIAKFPTPASIALQPDVKQLKEVKVNNKKWKQGILGNTTTSKSSNAGFTSNKLGNEIGAIIKIKRKPTFLKQFNASLANDVGTDSVQLRLNFYTVKNGLPDQLLQNDNIIVTVRKGQEKITVNLEPYQIWVDDNFYVSLEWIKNSKGHGIMFSAAFLRGNIITRETSQATWEKVGIAGLGFNVLAEW